MSTQKKLNKKEQFTRKEKSRLPLIAVVLVVVLGAVFALNQLTSTPEQADQGYFGEPVTSPRSYMGRLVSMTPVKPAIGGDEIRIPLSEIEEKEIVSFEVANDQGTLVPLMAYITPSGRVFAGSSMCEPCGGRTFSLAGETLVCDACRTTYTIETHEFISGSVVCGSYPPVNMQATVQGDFLVISLQKVLEWRIRAL